MVEKAYNEFKYYPEMICYNQKIWYGICNYGSKNIKMDAKIVKRYII